MNLKYKLLFLTVLFMTCIGAVSASSIVDDSIYLDTANDMGEISADDMSYESNMENKLVSSLDESSLSDNGDSQDSPVTTDTGGIRNISLSDGYNGYCIDMALHGSEPGQSFDVVDTSVIKSHIYDEPVGEYLKILFYNYYDEVKDDKDKTSELIWTFTDRYYKDSTNELILKVLSDYEGGLRVPDHGAVKKLYDDHEMVFDFETLISGEESIQNYFGYKVSTREIEDSSSTNDSSEDNGTETDSSDNETDSDSSDNETDTDNETNAASDLDESSQSSSNSADAGNAKELSLKKNMAVSGITAGNPLFALLLALAFIGLVPYKKE